MRNMWMDYEASEEHEDGRRQVRNIGLGGK